MSEIRSDPPRGMPRAVREPTGSRVVATVRRLDLPLRQPMDKVWSAVDEQVVPQLSRAVWNANGLRVGLLDPMHLPSFLDELPVVLGERRSQLSGGVHPVAIRTSPRLPRPVVVDLTVPPMAVRERRVDAGRMQILARVVRLTTPLGAYQLELIPHHHKPRSLAAPRIVRDGDRVRFEPRSAAEKELDGTIFTDLALRIQTRPGQIVVVGLYWPWDHTPIINFADQLDDGPEDKARPAPPRPETLDPPPLPNHIGRLLFAASRPHEPVQMVMLITIE